MTPIDDTLFDELFDAGVDGNMAGTLSSYVRKWRETRNPHFMDRAVELAAHWEVPFTKTFVQELASSIRARRDEGAKGSWDKVAREIWMQRAYLLMAQLRFFTGAPFSEAAEKAAAWVAKHTNGNVAPKASSIQKSYVAEFRRTGHEATFFNGWRREKAAEDEGRKERWRVARAQLPWLPNDAARGRRR